MQKNKNIEAKSTFGFKGWTDTRLISRTKLFWKLRSEGVSFTFSHDDILNKENPITLQQIVKEALAAGITAKQMEKFMDQSAKALFQANFLWKFFKKFFNLNIVLPFITGYYTTNPIRANLVTTRGKRAAVEQINGVSTAPMTAIALGTGTTAAAAGNTALEAESSTSGASRGAATTSNQTTTTTGDTARWVKTFTITGTLAITEEGIFDNNTSGGNMLARQVFTAVNVVNGDSLQITHNVQAT